MVAQELGALLNKKWDKTSPSIFYELKYKVTLRNKYLNN